MEIGNFSSMASVDMAKSALSISASAGQILIHKANDDGELAKQLYRLKQRSTVRQFITAAAQTLRSFIAAAGSGLSTAFATLLTFTTKKPAPPSVATNDTTQASPSTEAIAIATPESAHSPEELHSRGVVSNHPGSEGLREDDDRF